MRRLSERLFVVPTRMRFPGALPIPANPTTSSKAAQRSALAAAINSLRYKVMPCSFCHAQGLRCKIIKRSSRCSKYVRRGRSYNGSRVPVSSCRLSAPLSARLVLTPSVSYIIARVLRTELSLANVGLVTAGIQQQRRRPLCTPYCTLAPNRILVTAALLATLERTPSRPICLSMTSECRTALYDTYL